ncbi:MAG TPA: 2-phospho-L-lactate transferase [Candidatus Limnocylindria bacterium]|nr:2-phospho-L-lactate transferase [Candidatus Limnocylindria bacterium]
MRVALLSGGTGGAKLAHGFQQVLEPAERLSVIVNTGDDLELFGLHVSPDLDSVLYTLAGLVDPVRGWGVAGDTDRALRMLERYGEETWFWVGDADLGTLVRRSAQLRQGATLTQVTADMATALGVRSQVLPATDDRLRTRIQTDGGDIEFQRYFVERGQRDEVRGISFEGAAEARPTEAVLHALNHADLVVIGPSNPLVSIGPMLAMTELQAALAGAPGRRVAVSPIVGGRALKGPTDRMLASLGHEVSATGVARLYEGLVDGYVLDETDAELDQAVEAMGMEAVTAPTVMLTDADRAGLARFLLETAGR